MHFLILCSAFTLVELLAVLFIIVVMLAIAVPSFGRLREVSTLQASARAVVSMFRHARDVAVTRQEEVRVVFDSEGQGFHVETVRVSDAGAKVRFVPEPNPLGRRRSFPIGVTATAGRQLEGDNTSVVRFRPNGSTENVVVMLTYRSGRQLYVGMDGITGRTFVCNDREKAERLQTLSEH